MRLPELPDLHGLHTRKRRKAFLRQGGIGLRPGGARLHLRLLSDLDALWTREGVFLSPWKSAIVMPYNLDPNYNSLDRTGHWDRETQSVIKKRLAEETGESLAYEFLTEREAEILELLVDTLVPQEKDSGFVRVAQSIDRDLAGDIKGVRYGKNPWPQDFYRQGLAAIEKFSKDEFGKPVEDFSQTQLQKLAEKIFSLPVENFLHRFLQRVLSDATAIYFSHPVSWNRIGFPGPAFPEGYPFLDCGEKEKWEPTYEKESSKN